MTLLIPLLFALLQQAPLAGESETLGVIEGAVTRTGTMFPVAGVKIKTAPESTFHVDAMLTDAAGRFSLRGVPAGEIVLDIGMPGYVFGTAPGYSATLRLTVDLAPGQRLQLPISATPAASIRGRVLDSDGRPIPDASIAFLRSVTDALGGRQLVGSRNTARTNVDGEFRRDMLAPGDYYVSASLNRRGALPLSVYYPETTDIRTAALLVLSEGAEITADIRVGASVEADAYKVSGRVIYPLSKSVSHAEVILKPRDERITSFNTAFKPVDEKTGEFEFSGIRPGSYDVFATADVDDVAYFAKIPVEVRGRDAEALELLLEAGRDIRGSLVVEGESTGLQFWRPFSGNVRVELSRRDGLFENALRPTIAPSGLSFTAPNAPFGAYDITVAFVGVAGAEANPDLFVADIRIAGRSVFDTGIEVGSDPVDAIEVVVGLHGGSISGAIRGADANRAAAVVLAPELRRRGNASRFRRITVAPDGSGQFQVHGLTPGRYTVFAVPLTDGLTPDLTPEVLARYESRALSVNVEKGSSVEGLQIPLLSDR